MTDKVVFQVGKETKFLSHFVPSQNMPAVLDKEAKFEDIKISQALNINFKILPDGTFEAEQIIIFVYPQKP